MAGEEDSEPTRVAVAIIGYSGRGRTVLVTYANEFTQTAHYNASDVVMINSNDSSYRGFSKSFQDFEIIEPKIYVKTPENIKVIPVDQIKTRKPIKRKSKMIHQFGPVQLKR